MTTRQILIDFREYLYKINSETYLFPKVDIDNYLSETEEKKVQRDCLHPGKYLFHDGSGFKKCEKCGLIMNALKHV